LWVELALHVARYVVVGAVHHHDGVAQRPRRLLDEVLEAVVGKCAVSMRRTMSVTWMSSRKNPWISL
jgi:hypothetical protein